MNFESEKIEFKSEFTPDIYKEVIAFANTDGGVIYVGIDDQGNVIGLKDVDKEYTRLTNGIRDAIMPDVTMFVRFSLQDNKVVRITVSEGTNKPYYLKSKGLKPSGVYVRQGASSAPASHEQIRQLIKNNDVETYEEKVSLNQNLSFEEAKDVFQKCQIPFGEEKYKALGMVDSKSNYFTNLALLMSDQCVHTVKIGVYSDEECTIFRDRIEFGGSVLNQFEETERYLYLCNKTRSEIKGMYRHDISDYPAEAVREALLNGLIHRDYSYNGSIIINVTDERMEFISLGGLVPGLQLDDIRIGISQSRNKYLAEVFHRLRLVESYGTGIRRIFSLYENSGMSPEISVTPNAFKIILPNLNAHFSTVLHVKDAPINAQMQKILDYIQERGQITESEIGELLNVKKTRAYIIAKEMSSRELIKSVGRGKDKYYCL